jgi:hypothetical protein
MQGLLRALALIVLLLVGALVAVALILPGVVASDEFRERIGVEAENALGREVRYGAIDFGLFPPTVVVEGVAVAGSTAEASPMLEGGRLELRVAALPLLARTLVVDSALLRGARLHLVRTREGIDLPGRESTGDGVAATDRDAEVADFDLAVASVELDEIEIILEDRSVSPAVTLELRGIAARANARSTDGPIELGFEFEFASGGTVSGAGEATLSGVVELELKLSDVELLPLRAYLGSASMLSGRLSGVIAAVGPAAELETLRVDASLMDARFKFDDMEFSGALEGSADLHGSVAAPRGSFDIDATDAEVRHGGMFTKPPGDAASLQGKLVDTADGSTRVDDIRFKIQNFKGTASVPTATGLRVSVNSLHSSVPNERIEFFSRE